jgi:hypothetical protein
MGLYKKYSKRHCEERSDVAIPDLQGGLTQSGIATLSLAMTLY